MTKQAATRPKTLNMESAEGLLHGNDARMARKWITEIDSIINSKGLGQVRRGDDGLRDVNQNALKLDQQFMRTFDEVRLNEMQAELDRDHQTNPNPADSAITPGWMTAYGETRRRVSNEEKEIQKINTLSNQFIEVYNVHSGAASKAVIEEIKRGSSYPSDGHET